MLSRASNLGVESIFESGFNSGITCTDIDLCIAFPLLPPGIPAFFFSIRYSSLCYARIFLSNLLIFWFILLLIISTYAPFSSLGVSKIAFMWVFSVINLDYSFSKSISIFFSYSTCFQRSRSSFICDDIVSSIWLLFHCIMLNYFLIPSSSTLSGVATLKILVSLTTSLRNHNSSFVYLYLRLSPLKNMVSGFVLGVIPHIYSSVSKCCASSCFSQKKGASASINTSSSVMNLIPSENPSWYAYF